MINLIRKKRLYVDKDKKNTSRNLFKQYRQIIKYGSYEPYYFLYGFDRKTTRECDTYVNYTVFRNRRNYLNLFNEHNSSCILRNKLYFGAFTRALGIPSAKDVIYIEDGRLFSITDGMMEKDMTFIAQIPKGCYFVKSLDGENGDDIFKLTVGGGDGIITSSKNDLSPQDIYLTLSKGKWIIQEQIKQHKDIDKIYSGSINTLRIITVKNLKDGDIELFPSIMRIGVGGSFIDNGSKGGIMIGINFEKSCLRDYGVRKPEFGGIVYQHPDSKVELKGYVIPYLKESMELCKRCHKLLDNIHSIGWDVAITEQGPILIEGNDNWEIEVSQLYEGVKKQFDKLFY